MKDTKWDLNDIVLVPAEQSEISSRKECSPYYIFPQYHLVLPIMAAPMDTVVSIDNYDDYIRCGIVPCLPRGTDPSHLSYKRERYFMSFSLCEIETTIKEYEEKGSKDWPDFDYPFYKFYNVLIDIANGHMSKLVDLVKKIKTYWPHIKIMIGNIANPETFINLGMAGADYVRCSIGTGAGCTTAANVSINYPLGSLIAECNELRKQYALKTKIVADGGMRNYSDIIKALALGADFVMVGSIFNKAIESAGFNYLWKIKINNKMAEKLWRWGFPIKKKYRGMSTKAVQRSWGKSILTTAEGITKYQNVEYTLYQWTENFYDYLKSAMSYCNAKNLEDFIGKANYVFISEASRKRFEK